jgi:DNA recombination protein Rad52
MFTKEQEQALAAPLDGNFVKTRPGAGKQALSYIEGWRVIEQANRIFGAGNWSRETVQIEPLHEPKLITDAEAPERGKVVAAYFARVRVTVHSKDGARSCVREASGAARAFAKTAGEALENAAKASETDAMKRALATFGNALGLALYDPQQANVTPAGNGRREPAAIDTGFAPRRPTTSQRALGARNSKLADDIPV